MPSAAHQTLLLWAARKMACDGFMVVGYEGRSAQGGFWNALSAPPALAGVRPDAWGRGNTRIAFAEAKTAADIDTAHTRSQLRVFARIRATGTEEACRLYLAIPRSAAPALDCVLAELGLVGAPGIVRIHVPDVLLMEVA
jgi:hypothetical protein